ncbi:MAG: hypothetical protein SWY16_11180 [Cyanobacteriota bacterium]|nr:hypothetical protein [Cyanobacteriota bacterium]
MKLKNDRKKDFFFDLLSPNSQQTGRSPDRRLRSIPDRPDDRVNIESFSTTKLTHVKIDRDPIADRIELNPRGHRTRGREFEIFILSISRKHRGTNV